MILEPYSGPFTRQESSFWSHLILPACAHVILSTSASKHIGLGVRVQVHVLVGPPTAWVVEGKSFTISGLSFIQHEISRLGQAGMATRSAMLRRILKPFPDLPGKNTQSAVSASGTGESADNQPSKSEMQDIKWLLSKTVFPNYAHDSFCVAIENRILHCLTSIMYIDTALNVTKANMMNLIS